MVIADGCMNERCFQPLFCTIKAELGRGQPGLMRWSWDETLPQSSIDRSTLHTAAHRATNELAAAPWLQMATSSFFKDLYGLTYSVYHTRRSSHWQPSLPVLPAAWRHVPWLHQRSDVQQQWSGQGGMPAQPTDDAQTHQQGLQKYMCSVNGIPNITNIR